MKINSIKNKIETICELIAFWVYDNPRKLLLFITVIQLLMIFNLRDISIDVSTEGYLHKNDPSVAAYDEFRHEFGREEMIVIGIKSSNVFSKSFLSRLKEMHAKIDKNVPYLEKTTSLFNAVYVFGENDELIVDDLINTWPISDDDILKLKEKVVSSCIYSNFLISPNGDFTSIIIETKKHSSKYFYKNGKPQFISTEENNEIIKELEKIISEYNSDNFSLYMTGTPVMLESLKNEMLYNFRLFIFLSLAIIFLFLLIFFRRLFAVFIPLVITLISLVSAICLMVLLKVPLTVPTLLLPVFILNISVSSSIHVLSIFYQYFSSDISKKEAIGLSFKHSGLPVIMCSLTTLAGLLSFATASLKPLSELGLFATFGIFTSLIYTFGLIPAFIAIIPIKSKKQPDMENKYFEKIIEFISTLTTRHPGKIVVVSSIILLLSVISISKIYFSIDLINTLPDSSSLKKSTKVIDTYLGGANTIEVIIDAMEENGLYEPENLNLIEAAKAEILSLSLTNVRISKCLSINDIVKETHKALHNNSTEQYVIPQNRQIIAQELFLFEMSGSDEIRKYSDSMYRKARFTIKVTHSDASYYFSLIRQIESIFNKYFNGKAKITVTGMVSILGRIFEMSVQSAVKSYIIAYIVISLFMLFFIADIKIGLVSMIPNVFPVLFILGCISLSGKGLDIFTLLLGSIAIGLAVDDTIHFIHTFKKYHKTTMNVKEVVYLTLKTSGRAMIITSLALSFGFLVFIFSSLKMVSIFGYLTAATVMMALLADFIITPALLALIYNKKNMSNKN